MIKQYFLLTLALCLLIPIKLLAQDVSVSYKNISECLDNCEDKREILDKSLKDNGDLKLKLGAYLNCVSPQNPSATAKIRNDTLIVYIPEYEVYRDTTYITQSDSSKSMVIKEEVLEAMCSCFFHISLKIAGLPVEPKYVLLNGQTIE